MPRSDLGHDNLIIVGGRRLTKIGENCNNIVESKATTTLAALNEQQ